MTTTNPQIPFCNTQAPMANTTPFDKGSTFLKGRTFRRINSKPPKDQNSANCTPIAIGVKFTSLLTIACSLFVLIALLPNKTFAQSKEVAFTQDDRDRMIRTEIKLDERFNAVQKQMEQIDSRMEQNDKRIDRIENIMLAGFGLLFTSMIGLVGFILWDRRTFLKPIQSKIEEAEEKFMKQKTVLENTLSALRELAKTDSKVAQVLKQFNLL